MRNLFVIDYLTNPVKTGTNAVSLTVKVDWHFPIFFTQRRPITASERPSYRRPTIVLRVILVPSLNLVLNVGSNPCAASGCHSGARANISTPDRFNFVTSWLVQGWCFGVVMRNSGEKLCCLRILGKRNLWGFFWTKIGNKGEFGCSHFQNCIF